MQVTALESPLATTVHMPDQPAKIRRAASEFEGMLIEQMLRSARESASAGSEETDGGDQNSALMELSEQQFAQSLAHNGGLGIAKMVVAGLSKDANR
jgi:Rod binding domain-containing protein